jgi:hypothetical protein
LVFQGNFPQGCWGGLSARIEVSVINVALLRDGLKFCSLW